jgi:hypothetical protein
VQGDDVLWIGEGIERSADQAEQVCAVCAVCGSFVFWGLEEDVLRPGECAGREGTDRWDEESGRDTPQDKIKCRGRVVWMNRITFDGVSVPLKSGGIRRVNICALQGSNRGAEDVWQGTINTIQCFLGRWTFRCI